ncbi:hypothetical protein DQ04_06971020 [Trypanosoma grayi]|uniref:hypothetical protein n=1 Tax=Trypanosoma grayi TaxID=71804 RepID=UPI0004F40EAC|nr:hypothetical protein DQ04_06971020 [Trypanosoma grayi]KEG08534.1 hypothetical protein DQ04_06971020 [Trypanosoma grayi]
MSSRIVAFPYTPSADAPFADVCLSVKPGARLRVVRRAAPWAIAEADGRIGIFPLVFTRDEHEGKLVMRTARQDSSVAASLPPEESIVADDNDDANAESGAATPAGAECRAGEASSSPKSNSQYNKRSGSNHSSDSNSGSISGASASEEHTGTPDALFTRVLRSTERQGSTRGGGNRDRGTGAMRDSVDESVTEAKRREAEENEDEIIARNRLRRAPKEEKVNRLISLMQQKGEEDPEVRNLRQQYRELEVELAWLSHTTDRVGAERQRVLDARATCVQQRAAQQQAFAEELESLKHVFSSKSADVEKLQRCAASLRSILQTNGVVEGMPSSPHSTCSAPHELEAEEGGNVQEPTEEELAQNPVAAAEVEALKKCVHQEQETLRDYDEQRRQLRARMERLQRVQAAIDEESRALQESEDALDVAAPTSTYTVVRNSGADGGGGGSSTSGNADGNSALQLVGSRRSSVVSQSSAGDVDVVMCDGFAWPATLPGLTAEERDAMENYQRLLHKYEGKRQKWKQEHLETRSGASPDVVEKLRSALSTGDKALSELLSQTEKLKAFVERYGAVAATVSEQVAISRRLLQRQQTKCEGIRALYEAAKAVHNSKEENRETCMEDLRQSSP